MSRKKLLIVFVLIVVTGLLAGEAFAAGMLRVTGSGHVFDPDGNLRVATISARVMPDGTVRGEAQGVLRLDTTALIHYDVDCIRPFEMEGVDGKGAVLSGWSSFQKLPPGIPDPAYVVIAVFDAGEGNESGDIFSRGFPSPGPEFLDCNDPFPLPLIPLKYGNVQVSW